MPGRQPFAADVVGAQSPQAERVGKPLADAAGGAPQHQDRHIELAAEVGGVELAIRLRHGSRHRNRGSSLKQRTYSLQIPGGMWLRLAVSFNSFLRMNQSGSTPPSIRSGKSAG